MKTCLIVHPSNGFALLAGAPRWQQMSQNLIQAGTRRNICPHKVGENTENHSTADLSQTNASRSYNPKDAASVQKSEKVTDCKGGVRVGR